MILIGAFAEPAVAAELAPLLEEAAERALAVDGYRLSPAAWDFINDLSTVGDGWQQQQAVARNVAPTTAKMLRPSTTENMLTTTEVAKARGVSTAAVTALCRRGRVPGARLTAHGWRIPATYLEKQ